MVKISINIKRRQDLERIHTATHLLNYAARKVLGNHIWQHGSSLKPQSGTLDITHYKQLTQYELFEIEKVVQNAIHNDEPIFIEELERTTAEQQYGFRLYQGGAIPQQKLRIVHIGEVDIEACGGLHTMTSSQISLFKIKTTSKLQDGVIRVEFCVHNYAYEFIQEQQETLQTIAHTFSVDWKQSINASEKFFNEWKEQKKEIEQLQKEIEQSYKHQILSLDDTSKNSKGIMEFRVSDLLPMKSMQTLFELGMNTYSQFTLVSSTKILSTEDSIEQVYQKQIKRGSFYQYICK
ncbi:MAG: hypothetical protein ACLFPL_03390 [Candidatus Nanoarchaeia archaeon]